MLLQSHHLKCGTSGSVAHGEVVLNPVRDIGWVTLEMAYERWGGHAPLHVAAQNADTPITMTLMEAA